MSVPPLSLSSKAIRPAGAAAVANRSPARSAANDPPLTAWVSARPTYERTASTGSITPNGQTTTSAALKVALVGSGDYTFSAARSYAYTGKPPAVRLTLTDANGRIVKTSTAAALTLSRTETARLGSGEYTFKLDVTAARGGQAWLTSYRLDARQNLSPLPGKSGDASLDAIVAGGARWWHDEGQVATVSNTPITDTVKQIQGARTTLHYGFLGGTESYLSNADRDGFAAMNGGQRQAVVAALDYLSSLINVQFVEDASRAHIAFGTNRQTDSAGYAQYPMAAGLNPSVLMLDNESAGQATNTAAELADRNSYAWFTLIHELGHAMGLKHPGNYNAGGGSTPGPYLPKATDHRGTTVMSYRDAAGTMDVSVNGSETGYSYSGKAITPATYKTLDIAALQYLYGANTGTQAAAVTVNDNRQNYEAIWAPQGTTLDASSTTRTNIFDLRPGGYSSIAIQSTDDQIAVLRGRFRDRGVSDARSLQYAQALMGSTKALKGKMFDGRNTLGLAWGSRFTSVTGGAAADRFYAGTYTTTVSGGAGQDTLYLQGTARDWTQGVNGQGHTTYTHRLTAGVVTARDIEAVAFYRSAAAAV